MVLANSQSSWVKLFLPEWVWGGNPPGLLDAAGFRFKAASNSAYTIKTEESYLRTEPRLVALDHVAGPDRSRWAFNLIDAAARTESISASGRVGEETLARHIQRSAERGDLAGVISAQQLQLLTAHPHHVRGLSQELLAGLTQTTFHDDEDGYPFADAGVHLIRRSPKLMTRLKLPSLVLNLDDGNDSADSSEAELRKRHARGEKVFGASDALWDGHYLFESYTGPLLGALTPFIWAFSVHRHLGVIVFSFGTPIAGASGEAAEPLQLLPLQSGLGATPAPSCEPPAAGAALRWWCYKLNRLLAVLSDPGNHRDATGRYDPAKQLHAQMTVEQLFRRVTSIMTSHRDVQARRVLLFSALDTLEKLTGRDIEHLASLRLASKAAERLTGDMSDEAAQILLPSVKRSLSALAEVQGGFLSARGRGTVVVDDERGPRSLSIDSAAALYIKLLRNATHGHGGRQNEQRRSISLLKNHSGVVPHDLGLLAFLWLLDFVARPDDFGRILKNR